MRDRLNAQETAQRLRKRLSAYPKIDSNQPPTPIEYLKRASGDLGIQLYVKRDDCRGPVFGGHYSRSMEYIFGEVLHGEFDSVVHGGPSHSNQNRLVASYCAKFGLECHLVLRRKLAVDRLDAGNLFLDILMGAKVHWVRDEMGPAIDRRKAELAERLTSAGRHPYLFERSRIALLSCFGMIDFYLEIMEQLTDLNIYPTVYLTGCGPTHSGVLLASLLFKPRTPVVGVRPLRWNADEIVAAEVNMTAKELGEAIRITEEDVVNYAEYVGEDYGIPTDKCLDAIHYFAKQEGLIFDPVYTGKMAACLLDNIRDGTIARGSEVLILHTGGTPLTMLYSADIAQTLQLGTESNEA